MVFDEYDLIRSICQDSFFSFVKEFWDVVSPGIIPHWNWHIPFLSDELQVAAERVFANEPKEYDLITNISPGTTKSIVSSIMFGPWTWTRMANARHICASHTQDLVHDLSQKSRDVIMCEKYQKCWPHIQMRDDQNAKGHFKNTLGGERLSVTVGGKTPTGFHAHFITVDDAIDPEKALSDLELKKANRFVSHTIPSRKVNKDVTFTHVIGQRLHQNDPPGHLLEEDPARHRHLNLPAELTPYVKPAYLRKRYIDGLMDPVRLGAKALAEAKSKGEYYYAGQFLQHPVPLGGGMFKIDPIRILPVPHLSYFSRIERYWDKASTKDGDGAYTAGAKLGELKESEAKRLGVPRYWVLHIERDRLGMDEREARMKRIALMDGRSVKIAVEQEPGSGGKDSATASVKNLAGFVVRKDKPTGDKLLRAEPFAAQVNIGNVALAAGPWNQDYLDEMKFFPYSRYKDQIDASSGAFKMLTARTKVGCRG